MLKKCGKCKKILNYDKFGKNKHRKDGLRKICKICARKVYKKYYNENKDAVLAKDKIRKERDKDKIFLQRKKYRIKNREIIAKKKKEWRIDNLDKGRSYAKKWREKNPEKYKIIRDKCVNNRRKNINIRLGMNMSSSIRLALKRTNGGKRGCHWETMVGYTIQELKDHLESLFRDNMTWGNHGFGPDKWHIDHIIAQKKFKFTSYEDKAFKDCWALSNLQPLWQPDNLSKGAK